MQVSIEQALAIAEVLGGKPATSNSEKISGNEIAVLVTTANRGVFFGYTRDIDGETITLRNGRNCIYWSADLKGFIGLATSGPSKNCRVGPPANIQLRNITSVSLVSADAVAAWESAPWKS